MFVLIKSYTTCTGKEPPLLKLMEEAPRNSKSHNWSVMYLYIFIQISSIIIIMWKYHISQLD